MGQVSGGPFEACPPGQVSLCLEERAANAAGADLLLSVPDFGLPEPVAVRAALVEGVQPADTEQLTKIAGNARAQIKRGAWIANNHMQAFSKAPVDWRSLGL